MGEGYIEVLGSSSFDVLGVPVNSTVPLNESVHYPRPEVGHISGLPNHIFVDVTSCRSLEVGGSEQYEEILYDRNPIDNLDLSRLTRTGALSGSELSNRGTSDRREV